MSFALTHLIGFGAGNPGLSFQTSWSLTLNADQSLGDGYFIRTVIPASQVTISGSVVRVTVNAGAASTLVIDNAWIGHWSGSGNAYDFDGNQKRLTWDGGSNGKTVSSGGTAISDEVTFSLDETKNLILHMQQSSTGNLRKITGLTGYNQFYKLADDDGTNTGGGGMTAYGTDNNWVFSKVEVA